MSVHRFARRRNTALSKLCPAYAKALDEYEAALARGDYPAMARAWASATLAAESFRAGADYARRAGARA